ncbi:MAG: GH92 family glycosyl hydrolase [Clostridia bacterium]|nr:GH92 family glycosyl hydrolase [Clostridia bacterium]
MLRIFRAIVSLFLAVELLLGGLVSGGGRSAVARPETGGVSDFVDPMIGTGGIPWMCGMLSPAASAPFGCVRFGPDTCAVGGIAAIKTNTSGYYYEHRHLLGFSLGRLSGTGARDYGMFRVTPAAGMGCKTQPAALAFSHKNEAAAPGYYAVDLPGAAVQCEMTATAHAGLLRCVFRTDGAAGLYLDAAACISGGHTENTAILADPAARCLTAQATLHGAFSDRYGGLPVYLYAEWDTDAAVTAHTAAGDLPDTATAEGEDAGLLLRFDGIGSQPVTLRMGISFVSAENAKENLLTEVGDASFDEALQATQAQWEDRLGAIGIDADVKTKTVFYTALYHAMLMPTDFTDVNGDYLGFDGETHTAEGFTYRTDLSLWDTVRNAHALYTLIAPEIQTDCLQSLLRMAAQGGLLPRWPQGGGESGSMFGNPANVLFAESLAKGVPFDLNEAYAAVMAAAESDAGRDEAALYKEYGYLPDDLTPRYSVSKTLEYAWEDAAAAVLAEAAGDADNAAMLRARSLSYRNLWDAETQYFRPRNSDGSWGRMTTNMTSFFDDIFGTDFFRAYCEGSARQWRWSALNDPDGMVALFGSKEHFANELDRFMADAAPTLGFIDPGAGYWIGNQHDLHTAYLFNHADRPDLTQKWVRWTLANRFSTDPEGLDGNDDGGTLSSWYVFSALGFYPIAGTDRYWIGSPCVNSARVTLPNGGTLRIEAENQSDKNVYVSAVTLNGTALTAPFLTHAQLLEGGTLTFTMAETPGQ